MHSFNENYTRILQNPQSSIAVLSFILPIPPPQAGQMSQFILGGFQPLSWLLYVEP